MSLKGRGGCPLLGRYVIQRPDAIKWSLSFMLDRSPWEDRLWVSSEGNQGLRHSAHLLGLGSRPSHGLPVVPGIKPQVCPGGLRWPASSLTCPRTFAHALSTPRFPPSPSLSAVPYHASALGPQGASAEGPSLICSRPHDSQCPMGFLLSLIITAIASFPCVSSFVCAPSGP